MRSQTKVKFIISLAIIILVAMVCVVGYQLVSISKVRNQIRPQQQKISSLQEKLDSYEKTPNEEYEEILGE